jgi:hypothetical protein
MKIKQLAIIAGLALASALTLGQSAEKPAASSRFAGTWDAEMNGLPAVNLEIRGSGQNMSGTIIFYLQKRKAPDEPWRVTGDYRAQLLGPHLEGDMLSFEIKHYLCHGCSETGPNVRFRMEVQGMNGGTLHKIGDPSMPSVKLTRRE